MSAHPEPSGAAAAARPASYGVAPAVLALAWFAAMIWSARQVIAGSGFAEIAVTATAYSLPGAVSAGLVAGAAAALTALAFLGRRRAPGATARLAVATGTGLLVGLPGAVALLTINTYGWLYAVLGGTVAAAATLGGAAAGVRVPRAVAAACWGALAVFAVGLLVNLRQDALLGVFGLAESRASRTGAADWLALTNSLASGLAAGLVGFLSLRRARRRSGTDVPWPWYALAGAGPGLALLATEGLARTAGARIIDLAGRVSELELTVQRLLASARLDTALIVLFVGAVTAILAVGRTLPSRRTDDGTDDTRAADHGADRDSTGDRATDDDRTPDDRGPDDRGPGGRTAGSAAAPEAGDAPEPRRN